MLLRRRELFSTPILAYNGRHLLSWYPGTDLKDHSKYKNTTNTSNMTIASDKSFYFNGSSSYIEFYSNAFNNHLDNTWTISFWVNRNSSDGRGIIFGQPSYATNIEFHANVTSTIRFYWNNTEWSDCTATVSYGTWTHISIVSASISNLRFYVGTSNTWSNTSSSRISTSTTQFRWGFDHRDSTAFLGYMKDMRIYDYALSSSEIATVHNDLRIKA